MKNIKGKIEVAANLAIIVVAILLCIVLVKYYVTPAPAQQVAGEHAGERQGIKRGDAITISGVDWQKNTKTLLMVISSSCHFCTQSGPFYQRLVKEHRDAKLVALIPQSEEEGRAYLRRLQVNVDEVRQVSMEDVGVVGTPTLILADARGVATDVWVGALTFDKENEVIRHLSTEQASK